MPKKPWITDPTPLQILTTVSKAKALAEFLQRQHLPYDDLGIELNQFLDDVENAIRNQGTSPVQETGPEPAKERSSTD